jgi:hypothetical protein
MESTNTEDMISEPDDPNPLPAKQEQALRALLSHPTHKEAALNAGISETTLWRYTQNPEFARKLREARRDAVNHAVIRLQQSSSDAVTVLHNLMKQEDAPAAARITAARTVLDYSFRAKEMDELKARIEQLEEFLRWKQTENALDAASGKGGAG